MDIEKSIIYKNDINDINDINEIEENFCYINSEHEIIIKYKLFKKIIDFISNNSIDNYLFIIEKMSNIFNYILKIRKTIIVHLDLECLNMNDIVKHNDFICFFINYCQYTYPDKLEKCFVYKCPSVFDFLYSIISKLIDKKTREKINLIT